MTALGQPPPGAGAFILDFDGVVRHWRGGPVSLVEAAFGMPVGSILAAAHGVAEYERGIRGEVSFDDWCAATARALALGVRVGGLRCGGGMATLPRGTGR